MIQRIQSIYLAFVIMLCVLLFSGNVFSFRDESGKAMNFLLNGSITDQAGELFTKIDKTWPLTLILISIAGLSLVTILLFKNRKIQLLMAISVIIMSAALITALCWYAFIITDTFNLEIIAGYKMAIPVLILILSVLACNGILKDDRLVKSYDRLR